MTSSHLHPKDCPDQKAAALDRRQHEAALAEHQRRRQLLARAEWLDWYAVTVRK